MLNNAISYSLIGILLAIVGFFTLLQNNDTGVQIRHTKTGNLGNSCGLRPMAHITVIGDDVYQHSNELYSYEELVFHLQIDNDKHLLEYIVITASDKMNSNSVVLITNELKQTFPEVEFNWRSKTDT